MTVHEIAFQFDDESMRHKVLLDGLRAELASAMSELEMERQARRMAGARIAAALELHWPRMGGSCHVCTGIYPCSTVRALKGENQ